ncbi:MAG: Uma2 family endonuclease [Deltaproteobacteria bacterium]|nr:Uma2 family endonuclease [Deltaproteobacteria bacterium]
MHLGRPATWEDLERVPAGMIGEVIHGELVMKPRPAMPHASASSILGVLLGGPFRLGVGGPGGWVILDEPYIRFGEDVREPDLAGWRRERWVGIPRRGPIPVMPDWICEVLSCSTEAEDRTVKMPLYARAKVGHLWLLDPDPATLEVYRLEAQGWLLVSSHARPGPVRAEPFDAVELDLTPLWEDAGVPETPAEE